MDMFELFSVGKKSLLLRYIITLVFSNEENIIDLLVVIGIILFQGTVSM